MLIAGPFGNWEYYRLPNHKLISSKDRICDNNIVSLQTKSIFGHKDVKGLWRLLLNLQFVKDDVG